jgi:hypothetical protein
MADKHNFHVSCPEGWAYNGDVNIEHGGTFFSIHGMTSLAEGKDDCVWVVRVDTPWADNVFAVEEDYLYVPIEYATDEDMVSFYGEEILSEKANPLMWAQLRCEYVLSYYGLSEPARTVVQVGKEPDPYSRADHVPTAHIVLRANSRIENYLRKAHLNGHAV